MNNRFSDCETIKEAKTLYHKLLKENHPDLGGDEEITKVIVAEFEEYCTFYMNTAFEDFAKERGFEPSGDSHVFAEILAKVMRFNCRIEIIGIWIYAFESYEYRNELAKLGFFLSRKHSAYIYNGKIKRKKSYTKMTTDDVRSTHGSEVMREKEEPVAITA